MISAVVRAGLVTEGVLENCLQLKILSVKAAFLSQLSESERNKAENFIDKSIEAATAAWCAMSLGSTRSISAPLADTIFEESGVAAVAPQLDIEAAPPEEGTARKVTSLHVQRELSKLQDCTNLRILDAALSSTCNWSQLKRLKELRHPETSHAWLWHINPREGSVMTEIDYVAAVQKRLGAKIIDAECQCRICGEILDSCLSHSECCALADATRGHYAVVRAVVDGMKIADPALTTEPRGLVDSQARLADIFSIAAVIGRSAALDVSITSPDASTAGLDAVGAAFKDKFDKYRNILPQLHAAGIAFRPLIWSADGRPHAAVTRTLKFAAEMALRRRGGSGALGFLRRWRHEITVAIMRRRAAMMRAVLPKMKEKDVWLLEGVSPNDSFEAQRQPCIEEEADGT